MSYILGDGKLTIEEEIDESFVRNRSNVAKIRRRVETTISTIISDIEDDHDDSKEERENLYGSSDSESDSPLMATTINHA
jgi:hypothetical protein